VLKKLFSFFSYESLSPCSLGAGGGGGKQGDTIARTNKNSKSNGKLGFVQFVFDLC
jgi:hypothetical protein